MDGHADGNGQQWIARDGNTDGNECEWATVGSKAGQGTAKGGTQWAAMGGNGRQHRPAKDEKTINNKTLVVPRVL